MLRTIIKSFFIETIGEDISNKIDYITNAYIWAAEKVFNEQPSIHIKDSEISIAIHHKAPMFKENKFDAYAYITIILKLEDCSLNKQDSRYWKREVDEAFHIGRRVD